VSVAKWEHLYFAYAQGFDLGLDSELAEGTPRSTSATSAASSPTTVTPAVTPRALRERLTLIPGAEVSPVAEVSEAPHWPDVKLGHLCYCALDQTRRPVVLVDPGHHVIHMNDRFAKLFGYDAKSVVGRKADELIQSRQHLLDQTLADKLINSFGYTTKRSTSIVGFKDGRLFERRIERVTDPKTGEALGLCISYSDITRLQMMLSQKQVDADIAKAERGALLRFLLCTSHDLRMPLQVLSACFDMGPEGFAESVPLGQSAVAMMNMIMCNVLEVHKIEHGDVITNHVSSNFGAELSKLVGLLRVIRNSNIAFVADLAENVPHIIVDAPRLLRVVMNLITNAFKFTKQGSVTLTTKFADLGDGTGRLDVSVRDTGRGMDSATAAACTEMLVSAPADQDGGSGLGLFIVKNVVEEHRGQLRIESQVGVGTTMSFQIVVDIDQTEERPSSSGPSEVGCPPGRCLLVDDTFLIRKILSKLLTDDGHLPTAVASGNEALALLTEQGETFDVCFMDKTMPGLDGPQTVQKYRDWEKEHVSCNPPYDIEPRAE